MKNTDLPTQPNIVLIITDQQTWRPDWMGGLPDKDGKTLEFPAMQKLMETGVVFNRAHCNSCTCSPSRTTMLTGFYPAYHRVNQVLAFDDPNSEKQHNQQTLSSTLPTMGKMMTKAGYQVAYKGKWHVTKPALYVDNTGSDTPSDYEINQLYWTPEDVPHIEKLFGFPGWTYPDAGDDMAIYNFGGADINNDGRFVDGDGQSAMYGNAPPLDDREATSALNFINGVKTDDGQTPFFLVVSLVNPHDVLSFPGDGPTSIEGVPLYQAAGYKDAAFDGIDVTLPKTLNETLETKPKIQTSWKKLSQLAGVIDDRKTAYMYLQFYAYLTSLVDAEIEKVLDALKAKGLTEDTIVIRVSDHGDMGMSHGMQRQKMYNAYRQTINVPMIFSNPSFAPRSTEALAGLVDLMPTLADLVGADVSADGLQGKSLMDVLTGEKEGVQDFVHFTYDDDYVSGMDLTRAHEVGVLDPPSEMGAAHLRTIVLDEDEGAQKWKYSVYFDPNYGQDFEYELYDLTTDAEEVDNIAVTKSLDTRKNPNASQEVMQRMHDRLIAVMDDLGTTPDSVIWPEVAGQAQAFA